MSVLSSLSSLLPKLPRLHLRERAKTILPWLRYKLVTERAELDRYSQEHEGLGAHHLHYPKHCYTHGFEIAFDVDSTPVQYAHVAFTYPSGALCGTQLLWFHGGPLTERSLREVTCPVCLHLWERRGYSVEPPAVGRGPEKTGMEEVLP